MDVVPALQALARLIEGNRRFVAGDRSPTAHLGPSRRDEVLAGQAPFAVILGCSDSRVPVEHVFQQGLGDLFVIRVAGNIVAPSQIGSVEFAAEQFGTRLVVVLGHTRCGAIQATLDQLEQGLPEGMNLNRNVMRQSNFIRISWCASRSSGRCASPRSSPSVLSIRDATTF